MSPACFRRRHSQCNRLPEGTPGFPALARCDPSHRRTSLPYLIWTIRPRTTTISATMATTMMFVTTCRPRAIERTMARKNPPGPSSSAAPSISGTSTMSTTSASVWIRSRVIAADGERGSTSSSRRPARRSRLPRVSRAN